MTVNNKANSVDNKEYALAVCKYYCKQGDVKSLHLAFLTLGVLGDGLFSEVLHQIG